MWGRILSVYEASDDVGRSCSELFVKPGFRGESFMAHACPPVGVLSEVTGTDVRRHGRRLPLFADRSIYSVQPI